ncbi:MAG: integration host factor subunit beta [Bacteroidales bacterium]|nr:integration host factor subunit beta [Bacteroidales bacterium]MBR0053706.1 integration host factor subunit beta [Bacteroidales bacterium]MBR1991183.1 integration host factor subunit beta [Bacteroidales bacterium]MDD6581524.1 integration host factor subunit beta [Bacteroidales bacterium]
MTKAEMVNEIANKTGLDKSTVGTVVESFMDTIKDSLTKKDNVYLRGFGSFIIKHRAKKTARNIQAKKSIEIPAHDIPAFKPCKTFADQVK